MDYALLIGYGLLALLAVSSRPKPNARRAVGGLPLLLLGALVGWFGWDVARAAVAIGIAGYAPALPILIYDLGVEMEKKRVKTRKARADA